MPGRKSLATKTVHFEVNLDESDEGEHGDVPGDVGGPDSEVEEDGEPDEFFDVLDILDGRADPLSDDEPPAPSSRQNEIPRAPSDEGGESDDSRDSQDTALEPDDQLMPSDDEADVDALQNLGQLISNLDSSTKRKNFEDNNGVVAEDNAPRKKRKLLRERNEAGAENEFAASGELEVGTCGIPLHPKQLCLIGQTKLNFEDLLAPLAGQSSNMDSLKKSAKVLTSSKNKALSAPLPQRTQDRLEREAAYEQTKREVDKWQATMKHIKEVRSFG